MAKPWEETWEFEKGSDAVYLKESGSQVFRIVRIPRPLMGASADVMFLAAAAPDLYRALVSAMYERDSPWRCRECGSHQEWGTHRDGCALDAALRKARGE